MPPFGRILILTGVALIVTGLLVSLLGRANLPLGRLPGDMSWRGRGWTVSFPLATSLLLSVLLSLVFWLFNRFR